MTLLLGSTGTGSNGSDFGNAGQALGSKYVCGATGIVDTITFRRNSTAGGTTVHAGIFTDNAGTPSRRLGNIVTITTTNTLAWFTSASGVAAPVISGKTYWILLMVPSGGGSLQFRTFDGDVGAGGTAGGTKEETTTGRATLPLVWAATNATFAEIIAAYAEGVAGTTLPPTFVLERESAWQSTATPKAASSFTPTGNETVIALGAAEQARLPSPAISDSNLNVWDIPQQPLNGIDSAVRPYAIGWALPFATATPLTVSVAHGAGGAAVNWGWDLMEFSGSLGYGASASVAATSNQAGTVSITTQQDNSAVAVIVSDFNHLDGASRVWATVNGITPTAGNGYELAYNFDVAHYTVYVAYYPDVGTAGAKTVGITTPGSTMLPAVVAIEVKGTVGVPPADNTTKPARAGMWDTEIVGPLAWF